MDARSQCGSTHGSTSDDTGSSMSTVIDRFSTSDRVSTISTASSTASTASEQPGEYPGQDFGERTPSKPSTSICPFEDDYHSSSPPDYLLRRLASSEAVTHVESRGEVERITAVVAPNTVLIEETITFQPPLSFQDAPLSYGHEARPDLFYTADLAADSTTHFRPIKDDVELVERVNSTEPSVEKRTPPPLPARNHVNRITVNRGPPTVDPRPQRSNVESDVPVLPPKPLPRRDVKIRRKRPPPPPPPPPPAIPPRAEAKPPSSSSSSSSSSCSSSSGQTSFENENDENETLRVETIAADRLEEAAVARAEQARPPFDLEERRNEEETDDTESMESYEVGACRTNKVLEIIEIRKARAFPPRRAAEEEEEEEVVIKSEDKVNRQQEESKRRIAMEDSDEQVTKFNEPVDEESEEKVDSTRRESDESEGSYRSCVDESSGDRPAVIPTGEQPMEDEDETSEESDEGDYYWQSNLATIGEEEETNSLEYATP